MRKYGLEKVLAKRRNLCYLVDVLMVTKLASQRLITCAPLLAAVVVTKSLF